MRCLEGLRAERELHRQVMELAVCGVRPLTIRAVMGHCISLAEISRIFKLSTYLAPGDRRGRGISASNLRRMDPEHLKLFCALMSDMVFCIEAGAGKADSLAAVWRIETSRRGMPAHSTIRGASLEDLAILYLNLEVGELQLNICGKCAAPVLGPDQTRSTCGCRDGRPLARQPFFERSKFEEIRG